MELSMFFSKKFMTSCFLLATMMMPGYLVYASQYQNTKLDAFRVSTNSVQNVKITATKVIQQESGLMVSGQVKRLNNSKSRKMSHGHIDVTVINPAGKVIYKTKTNYYPQRIPRQGTKKSGFNVTLPVQAPDGSQVQLDFHRESIS
jgi:hypothetical protein